MVSTIKLIIFVSTAMAQRVLSSAWKLLPGILLFYSIWFCISHIVEIDTRTLFYAPTKIWMWMLVYLAAPILLGLITAKLVDKMKVASQGIIKFIGFLWLGAILVIALMSKSYWNYFLRRPGVFHEVSSQKEIMAFYNLGNVDYSVSSGRKGLEINKGSHNLEDLKKEPKSYYQFWARAFHSSDEMLEHELTTHKLSITQVLSIEGQIESAGIIDSAGSPQFGFSGNGISFRRKNETFLFLALRGTGEVSNDHHHAYEVLFQLDGEDYVLKKYQKFYFDIAGIEGTEFSNVLPAISVLLLILLIPALAVSEARNWKKARNQASIS